jgi:hypothetical protein
MTEHLWAIIFSCFCSLHAAGWEDRNCGSISGRSKDFFLFSTLFRLAVGPTQPCILWMLGPLCWNVMYARYTADHLCPLEPRLECVKLYLHCTLVRLWVGLTRVWIPEEARDFSVLQNIQTSSSLMGTGALSWGKIVEVWSYHSICVHSCHGQDQLYIYILCLYCAVYLYGVVLN